METSKQGKVGVSLLVVALNPVFLAEAVVVTEGLVSTCLFHRGYLSSSVPSVLGQMLAGW